MHNDFMNEFIKIYQDLQQTQNTMNKCLLTCMLQTCIKKLTTIKEEIEKNSGYKPISPLLISEMIMYCQLMQITRESYENTEEINRKVMRILICCQMMECITDIEKINSTNTSTAIKRLSREEFFNTSKEEDSCYSEQECFAANVKRPNMLSDESRLYRYGYSVAQNSSLTDKGRKELLKKIIEDKKMKKDEIISFLKHLIKVNGQSEKNYLAIRKWQSDLNYVLKL